jgi:integrase
MSVKKRVDGHDRVKYQTYVWDVVAKKNVYIGTFDRLQDADDAEYEAKRRLRMGESLKPAPAREQVSFDVLAIRWVKGLSSIRPSTREDYRKAIRRLKPFIGRKQLADITRRDIDEVISVLSRDYAPSTVRKTITIAKMVFRVAIDWSIIDRMPTGGTRLPLPKVRKRTFRPLTREEVTTLLDSAPPEWRVFYLLLVTTGLRRAEGWGLTAKDVDLDAGVIHVRRQLVRGRLEELKTDSAQRKIPIPAPTVEALRLHLANRADNPLDLVFATPEGKPIDASNFYSRVHQPTRERAGLLTLRLHDLRHQFCSTLLASGRSVKYVQTVAGHADASTTLNIYGWLLPGEDEAAVADLEKWLGMEEWGFYAA